MPSGDIHGEAIEMIEGQALGNPVPPHDVTEGREDGVAGRPGQGSRGLASQRLEAEFGGTARLRIMAQDLTVDHVVAVTAPSVEHHGIAAHGRREKARRRREALGAVPDGRLRLRDGEVRGHGVRHHSAACASGSKGSSLCEPSSFRFLWCSRAIKV